MRLSSKWYKCPKCGARFEKHGETLKEIKFGKCPRCGYKDKKNVFKYLLRKIKIKMKSLKKNK